MYAQVDDKGIEHEIIEHEGDDSDITKDDGCITCGFKEHNCNTSKGWHLLVTWTDGSSTWETLKNIKEFNPTEVSKYEVVSRIIN